MGGIRVEPLPFKGASETEGMQTEFEFVIENMRQGIWRLNSFGIITYANPYLGEWLEIDRDEMVGEHFTRFRSLRPVEESHVDTGVSQRYEAEFVTTSGIRRRAIVVTSPAINESGSPSGTIDLITDITAERAVQTKLVLEVQKMARLATTDPVTGASNRHLFDRMLTALVETGDNEPFGVIVLDLDDFKRINDEHGHEWGDRVLMEVAHRISSAVRENDVLSRVGGDEFAVLLPNASRDAVLEIANRLKPKLRFELASPAGVITVSASIGSAHSADGTVSILSLADRQMYRSKHTRKHHLA